MEIGDKQAFGVFRLVRTEDVSGVSGEGIVAYGTVYPNQKVSVCWCVPGKPGSVVVYDSFKDMQAIHTHGGKTYVDWLWAVLLDEQDEAEQVISSKLWDL